MPLPDLPFNDQLAEFGMPWHGLLVRPATGTAADQYIRLASGRTIPRPVASGGSSFYWDTYLIDRGMPAVQMTPSDPEGAFWTVAIGGMSAPSLSVWGNVRAVNRVKHGGQFIEATLDFTVIPDGSRYVSITSFGNSAPPVRAYFQALGIPDDVPTGYDDSFTVRYLDISRDGRRFLCALVARGFTESPTTISPAYTIDFRENQPKVGTWAIFEVAFDEALTAMTVTTIAGYEACFTGALVSSADGADYEWRIASRIITATGVTLDDRLYSPTGDYPGLPQYCGVGVGEPCRTTTAQYSKGVSEAVSVRETVVGAWYTETGSVELITVRSESRVKGDHALATLGPGDQYFVSNYTFTTVTTGSIRRGSGAWSPLFDYQTVFTQSAAGRTFAVTLGGESVYSASIPWPASLDTNDVSNPAREVAPLTAARFDEEWSFGTNRLMTVCRMGWNASNKVITAITRLVDEQNLYCEYFVSGALTPAGMDNQSLRTGNVWDGCRRPMPNGSEPDPAVARYHRYFEKGAYNPVTGEVRRNQTGGDQYTWV
ncbi:MAG: hypothetical protein KUL87_20250 [Pseudomonas sp.]|nr:hypothetical protein [Pseudomonas sp.]